MHEGKRFGYLTAKRFIEKRNEIPYWEFECDCGNTKIANIYNIKRRPNSSCGCKKGVTRREDVAGKRWGMLTALRLDKTTGFKWHFRCDCGKVFLASLSNVKRGNTKSCGCLKAKIIGDTHRTHGKSRTKEYRAYCHAKARCENPNDKEYKRYGERGVKFEWDSFEQFLKDMGKSPKGTSIDRIDNNKNYTSENCRWATPRQQANNRRTNRYIEYNGEKLTVAQWSRRTGIKGNNITRRIDNYGWSIEKALC